MTNNIKEFLAWMVFISIVTYRNIIRWFKKQLGIS
jgi:hypothetical protein